MKSVSLRKSDVAQCSTANAVTQQPLLPIGKHGPTLPVDAPRQELRALKSAPPKSKDKAKQREGGEDAATSPQQRGPTLAQRRMQERDAARRSNPEPAAEIKQLAVLDWDDCVRDEKGMTYQLLHNALAITARESEASPLGRAVAQLHKRMQSGQPATDNDPLLMRTQEDFTKHLMVRHHIFSPKIARDFVDKMLPELGKEEAASLAECIHKNFKEQYYRAIGKGEPIESNGVPFPHCEPKLLPGARELLEKIRTPDSCAAVISNRDQDDLADEVKHMNMLRYFDVISGSTRREKMPEDLQKRIVPALRGGDREVVRRTLIEARCYAHPDSDSKSTGRMHIKPDPARLNRVLEQLQVGKEVPIISYGDQLSDVKQMAGLAKEGWKVKGVIINSQNPDVGKEIDVDGIPTTVIDSMEKIDL
ncbi:HAD hydrolase-like protein [Xanthomonas fragariae]|uniref:HAD hydrolase-like protein n=1 Tax=Xanthomonas fragariae TaxID=48664 RepID=UPI0022AA97C4|nr:HAD hydrolase-like protein [Xanthomonas fragariae]WAT14142.1 HAD hydrolase-like protein [Xanthomonas fragariae]